MNQSSVNHITDKKQKGSEQRIVLDVIKSKEVLFRCRFKQLKDLAFPCCKCLQVVKDKYEDTYQYGGTWKSKKDSINAISIPVKVYTPSKFDDLWLNFSNRKLISVVSVSKNEI